MSTVYFNWLFIVGLRLFGVLCWYVGLLTLLVGFVNGLLFGDFNLVVRVVACCLLRFAMF